MEKKQGWKTNKTSRTPYAAEAKPSMKEGGKMARGGYLEGREEYEGYKYLIWYRAPKGYSVSGGDESTKKMFDNEGVYFENYNDAKEHAEISIRSVTDDDHVMKKGGSVGSKKMAKKDLEKYKYYLSREEELSNAYDEAESEYGEDSEDAKDAWEDLGSHSKSMRTFEQSMIKQYGKDFHKQYDSYVDGKMKTGGSVGDYKIDDAVSYKRKLTGIKNTGKVIEIDNDGKYLKVRNNMGNIDYLPTNEVKKMKEGGSVGTEKEYKSIDIGGGNYVYTNGDKINPSKLVVGHIYEWTRGAERLFVEYVGREKDNQDKKVGSSIGKQEGGNLYLFKFINDSKNSYTGLSGTAIMNGSIVKHDNIYNEIEDNLNDEIKQIKKRITQTKKEITTSKSESDKSNAKERLTKAENYLAEQIKSTKELLDSLKNNKMKTGGGVDDSLDLKNIYERLKKSPNFKKVEFKTNEDGHDYVYILSKLKGLNEHHEDDFDEFTIFNDQDYDNELTLYYEPSGFTEEMKSMQEILEMTRAFENVEEDSNMKSSMNIKGDNVIESNIHMAWSSTQNITDDIRRFIVDSYEAAGEELAEDVIAAIEKGIELGKMDIR